MPFFMGEEWCRPERELITLVCWDLGMMAWVATVPREEASSHHFFFPLSLVVCSITGKGSVSVYNIPCFATGVAR